MTGLAAPVDQGSPRRTTPAADPVLPRGRTLRLGLARAGYEVRAYFRQPDSVFFTFLFPLLFLGIFSTAFANGEFGADAAGEPVSAAQYYLPGMLAAGLLLSGLQNMAIDIAVERGDGTLKRLAGTPLPVVSYFIGKMGQVLVTGAAQAVLLLATAALVFRVPLPDEGSAWLTIGWVFLLGVTTNAVLGIALSRVPRTGKSAVAVIIPITLVLQFVSGVYLPFTQLPDWLQNAANVFPLAWLAHGLRSALLPDTLAVLERGEAWNLGAVGLVSAAWLVGGLVLCRLTFRWIRKDT